MPDLAGNREKFQHFIITPFNVDIGVKPREEILSVDYLSNRLDIFKKVCFPSLVRQSNQNFKWLVFFDKESLNDFHKEIDCFSGYSNFSPIFTECNVDFHEVLKEAISNHLLKNIDFIITSNLDSDDALGFNYIQLVQDNFNGQEFEFVHFPFGYILRPDGLFLREYLSSPFISLIEKIVAIEDLLTSKLMTHSVIYKLSQQGLPVRQVFTHPNWLQVVHDRNWRTRVDVNSILQPISRLKNNFYLQDFVSEYLQCSYKEALPIYLKRYLKRDLIKNKSNLSISRRMRNLLALISPLFPPIYLRLLYKFQKDFSGLNHLSAAEAKQLCKQQQTWYGKAGSLPQ